MGAPAGGKGDPSQGAAAAAAQGEREGARPDRGPPPPVFNGQIGDYREFRKKVELYAARARGRDAEHTVGLDLMGTLTGRAWENVEDMDVARISEPRARAPSSRGSTRASSTTRAPSCRVTSRTSSTS